MISFRRAGHSHLFDGERRVVLESTTLTIPAGRRTALLGSSQQDVGILIDLITGVERPKVGYIDRNGTVSFQIGYLGGFEQSLTVTQNLKHVARIYDTDVGQLLAFVRHYFHGEGLLERKFKYVNAETRRRLGTVIGYGISFDTYVVNFGRSGARLQARDADMNALFEARVATSGFVMATMDLRFAEMYCNSALLFHDGRLYFYKEIAEGVGDFRVICREIGLAL